jgi:hypothetical protein
LAERHGFYASRPPLPLIWLHAVSVGETRAAEPLIDSLLRAYPGHGVLLTHMTPTGRATGSELLARHPGRLTQAYLPYDLPAACGRFLDHFQPADRLADGNRAVAKPDRGGQATQAADGADQRSAVGSARSAATHACRA